MITKSVSDEYHTILDLSYRSNPIEEIRLYHVFEHFTRASALAGLFEQGFRIDVTGYDGFIPTAVHQELDLILLKSR